DAILGLTRNDFENQAPLVVEPHRPLVRPLTLQLLEMQGFESVQIALVSGSPNLLHSLPVRLDGGGPEAGFEVGISFQSVECLVRKPRIGAGRADGHRRAGSIAIGNGKDAQPEACDAPQRGGGTRAETGS